MLSISSHRAAFRLLLPELGRAGASRTWGHPCSLRLSRPSPRPGTLPPSLLGPSCCGLWGGGWAPPERGSGKGTLEGPWDAEPLWPGTAVLTSTGARQGHLALLCLASHAGQGPQPVSHQAAQSHGHPHPVVTLLVPDWGAGPRASFPVGEGQLDSQGLWGSGCLPSPRGLHCRSLEGAAPARRCQLVSYALESLYE